MHTNTKYIYNNTNYKKESSYYHKNDDYLEDSDSNRSKEIKFNCGDYVIVEDIDKIEYLAEIQGIEIIQNYLYYIIKWYDKPPTLSKNIICSLTSNKNLRRALSEEVIRHMKSLFENK